MEGNSIVCPYHSWAFDRTGQCTQIPYCSREPSSYGKRVNAPQYECVEVCGLVLAWFHADGEPPGYQPTLLQETEARMVPFGDYSVPDWHMHITEPSLNSCDWYHFRTVHQWLGQSAKEKFKWLWVKHACRTHMQLLGSRATGDQSAASENDPNAIDGEKLPPEMIVLEEGPAEIWLWGILPIPGFTFKHFKAQAAFQGPQLSVFKVSSRWLGECHCIFTFTPEKPFLQRCFCRGYCTRWFPRFFANFLAHNAIATIEQDRSVWENKLTCNPKNLVAKDGPFAAYSTWIKQFYSDSSMSWGQESLDW